MDLFGLLWQILNQIQKAYWELPFSMLQPKMKWKFRKKERMKGSTEPVTGEESFPVLQLRRYLPSLLIPSSERTLTWNWTSNLVFFRLFERSPGSMIKDRTIPWGNGGRGLRIQKNQSTFVIITIWLQWAPQCNVEGLQMSQSGQMKMWCFGWKAWTATMTQANVSSNSFHFFFWFNNSKGSWNHWSPTLFPKNWRTPKNRRQCFWTQLCFFKYSENNWGTQKNLYSVTTPKKS